MKAGTDLEWCIRAIISVDDPVKRPRDPVIYRCNLQPHHRARAAWKVYPTYDFCAPFLDSLEVAPRHTAIPKDNAVTAIIHGVDKTSTADRPKHNKNTSLGTKKVFYSKEILFSQEDARSFKPNEEITLMNRGNAIVTRVPANESETISELELQLHLEGDFKKTEKKVTWLAKETPNMIPARLFDFDYLITKDKLEKKDDLFSFLTNKTESLTEAWG
ncbi:glutamate--tRNA ligase [Aspergillus melleus]|uniref:Glutamate--tRNA ligase n=1 Tax=Aspergillus melleus TaxID=138277 RepID=A0ACC3B2X7_9EURO|nr:glutamate--tRNA ligase [Aspergillus melleus]